MFLVGARVALIGFLEGGPYAITGLDKPLYLQGNSSIIDGQKFTPCALELTFSGVSADCSKKNSNTVHRRFLGTISSEIRKVKRYSLTRNLYMTKRLLPGCELPNIEKSADMQAYERFEFNSCELKLISL